MIWIVETPKDAERRPEPTRRVRAQLALYSCSTARLRRVELALRPRFSLLARSFD